MTRRRRFCTYVNYYTVLRARSGVQRAGKRGVSATARERVHEFTHWADRGRQDIRLLTSVPASRPQVLAPLLPLASPLTNTI